MPDAAPPQFRRVVKYAVLCGLTQFFPVPWLDDWLLDQLRKTMVYRILLHQDLPVDRHGAKLLALGPEDPHGCLSLILGIPKFVVVKVLLYGLKKLLKKIFIVFAIRDYAKVMIDAFEQGYLILVAAENDRLSPEIFQSSEELLSLHDALEKARLEPHNAIPFRELCVQALKGSKTTILQSAKALAQIARQLKRRWSRDNDPDQVIAEEELDLDIDDLTYSLADGIWAMTDYRQALERSLDRTMNG